MENKKIYFKDLIKDKTYDELMKLIPCMVCIEEKYTSTMDYHYYSYDVVGFGPDYVVLGNYTIQYSEDEPSYRVDTYRIVNFKDITEKYIFAHRATDKQMRALYNFGFKDECVSGYEAWNILHEKIEQLKTEKENRKSYQPTLDDYEDGWESDWRCSCFDPIDMMD